MKKHIARLIGLVLLASVICSVTSCTVEYREHHHHYDHDHYYDHY
jgi:hypothetical protein